MSKYLEIRDDIKAKLTAVAGVGVVHGRARLAVDWGKYIELFRDTSDNKIRGWVITRGPVPEHLAGAYWRHHRFILRGHLGFSDADATDEDWQVLIDEVCAAFRGVLPADPAVTWRYRDGDNDANSPAQVTANDIRLFGSALCHFAEIHLSVSERITP